MGGARLTSLFTHVTLGMWREIPFRRYQVRSQLIKIQIRRGSKLRCWNGLATPAIVAAIICSQLSSLEATMCTGTTLSFQSRTPLTGDLSRLSVTPKFLSMAAAARLAGSLRRLVVGFVIASRKFRRRCRCNRWRGEEVHVGMRTQRMDRHAAKPIVQKLEDYSIDEVADSADTADHRRCTFGAWRCTFGILSGALSRLAIRGGVGICF